MPLIPWDQFRAWTDPGIRPPNYVTPPGLPDIPYYSHWNRPQEELMSDVVVELEEYLTPQKNRKRTPKEDLLRAASIMEPEVWREVVKYLDNKAKKMEQFKSIKDKGKLCLSVHEAQILSVLKQLLRERCASKTRPAT